MTRFLSILCVYAILSFIYYVILMPELILVTTPDYSILCDLLLWSDLSFDRFLETILILSLFVLFIFTLVSFSHGLNLMFASLGTLIVSFCVGFKAQLMLAQNLIRSNFKDRLSEIDPNNFLLRFFPEVKIKYNLNDFKAALKHFFEIHNYEYSTIKTSSRESLLKNVVNMSELKDRVDA